MSNETYIPFSELVAQGSSRIIGSQRVDTDRAGDLTEHLERFRNSPLAQECAAQLAQRALIGTHTLNGGPAWNKGISYVIAKRAVYANKGSWMKAVKRLYPDACMRCGWDEGPCDVHHISPKSLGGAHTLDNGIILCPNCHRLTHVGKVTTVDLQAIKNAAVALVDAR